MGSGIGMQRRCEDDLKWSEVYLFVFARNLESWNAWTVAVSIKVPDDTTLSSHTTPGQNAVLCWHCSCLRELCVQPHSHCMHSRLYRRWLSACLSKEHDFRCMLSLGHWQFCRNAVFALGLRQLCMKEHEVQENLSNGVTVLVTKAGIDHAMVLLRLPEASKLSDSELRERT